MYGQFGQKKSSKEEMDKLKNPGFDAIFAEPIRPREEPPMPSTQGVEYNRVLSWSTNLESVMTDLNGRALFRVFLFRTFADENLSFVENVEKLKRVRDVKEKKTLAQEIVKSASGINMSASSMAAITKSANSDMPDLEDWKPALKEINRHLENDAFPRFKVSDVYFDFLELVLTRAEARRWAESFDALLRNMVGRHKFRVFLRSIGAEENIKFWDAVIEFRKARGAVPLATDIIATYLSDRRDHEELIPRHLVDAIKFNVEVKSVDISLFDEATKFVMEKLRGDQYTRFLKSDDYMELIKKLTR